MDGDVLAEPGTDATYGGKADKGFWKPGPVRTTAYPQLTVGGVAVVHEASCEFTFEGSRSTPNGEVDVPGTETVTLRAAGTKLQSGLSHVLLDGESKSDAYGNTLRVEALGRLRLP